MRPSWGADEARVGAYLRGCSDLDLTYAEIHGTRGAQLPVGYHHVERRAKVGSGDVDFSMPADALLRFAVHRAAGLLVVADTSAAVVGGTAAFAVGFGPMGLLFACRVVDVVEEDRRAGFAYGTLPGHPESGEEAFTVVLTDAGVVEFQIRAFSKPSGLIARAGSPLGRLVQRRFTDRYVSTLQRLTAESR